MSGDVFDNIANQLRDEGVGVTSGAAFCWDGGRLKIMVDQHILDVWVHVVEEFSMLLAQPGGISTLLEQQPFENDPVLNAAWQLFSSEKVRVEREGRCNVVLAGVAAGFVEDFEVDDWLRVCNELRSVVVGKDPDEERLNAIYSGAVEGSGVFRLASAFMHELLAVT